MIRAIILDFDGVIVDSEPLHHRAFVEALRGEPFALSSEKYFADYVGLSDRDIFWRLNEGFARGWDAAALARLAAAKDAAYRRLAEEIPLLPGVAEAVKTWADRYRLTVCSGARRVEIESVLRGARATETFEGRPALLQHFEAIVSADDVQRGKPNPEGYILAFERLQSKMPDLKKSACVAVEDTALGIAAAQAAGLRVFAMKSPYGRPVAAVPVIEDLRELDCWL